ncbi:hypothetical protein BGZ83_006053 [Gryganskiella cystojenkinii]|nr:hypothetical protein BGZ83_006053 [Gryganskiella cystojenkinii]
MLSTVSLIDPTTLNPSFSGPDTSRMGRPAVIITRADQQTSVDQFQQLLTSAKAYRLQMLALSKAAAAFGYALEKIAHSKASVRDPSNVCSSLQAAAGLHYLMSNHHQILSDTLYKQFEIPLLQHLDTHKANIEASEAQYERSMRDMSQKIKETEATSLQNGRKRQRDLLQFRQALTTLTMQVDELERIKIGYYFGSLESEQANLQLILQKTSTIVRAEVDIYERIANKGLNDTILEPMTTQGPDPYCTYPTTDEFSSIFSILPPTPIIPTGGASTSTTTPQPETAINFYGYHEVNPFSTARNQTNNQARDRHLFGEASSVESKASMMNQAATILSKETTVAESSSTTTTTATAAKAVVEIECSQQESAVTTLTVQESSENQPPQAQLQSVPEEPAVEIQSEAIVQEETVVQVDVEEETVQTTTSSATKGVDLRSGENHHRRRRGSTKNSKKDVDESSQPASSVNSEQASSSIPPYNLRSRSGSRSQLMLASTPDYSPPAGASIHISKDSELLNNRDFSFSYEPKELLEQRNHEEHHHHHHTQINRFSNGFEDMDDEDFRGTSASSPAAVPAHHGLLHRSSHGHLSHSSSSNLSSVSSGSMRSLHHRRSTGTIKTSSQPGEGGQFDSSANMFGTSLDEPFLPLMKQHVELSDHIRELGRGFDDGMPAFFSDDADDEERASRSSMKRNDSSEGDVSSLLDSRVKDSDSIRMADGSSKEMSASASASAAEVMVA